MEDEILNGYLPYHQLTVDDFAIKDDLGPDTGYSIQTFIHYYYNCIGKTAESGVTYTYVKDWTVFSGFNKNLSGRRGKFRDMKDALPYAQALLDLNEIYARRLGALQPGDLPSGSGRTWPEAQRQLEERLEKLCQSQLWEARKEGETFTAATKNGQNKKRVRELSAAIRKRLVQLPIRATPTTPLPSRGPVTPSLYIPPLASPSPSR